MLPFILRSLRHYWRTHLGVFAATTLATAILTGALLVGDSVDQSLRNFATMRLGTIHHAIDTRTLFFNDKLAADLSVELDTPVASLLQVRGMAIHQGDTAAERTQINQVQVLGIQDDFWQFAPQQPDALQPNHCILNEKLARALQVNPGDEIALRVAKPSLLSRDAPLSWASEDRSKRRRYTVQHIVSDENLGRFSLSPSQIGPYNAFIPKQELQSLVELDERSNLALASTNDTTALEDALTQTWDARNIGVHFKEHPSGIIQLGSDRVYLSAETARAGQSLNNAQPTLTYLVNSINTENLSTPYSFVIGGPVPEALQDDEIIINQWLADTLQCKVGERLTLEYAELQSDSSFLNKTRAFTIHSITPMEAMVIEKDLAPIFPGLSDVESCSDWDVGIPMDDEVLNDEANEAYWDAYGQTPKAMVTLAAARDMWANRFGDTTTIRYTADDAITLEAILSTSMDPAQAGFVPQPVRDQAIKAVDGAMDFGGLFIGMSFFLIIAVLLLIALLFTFGVQQRAREMGTLLAMGFTHKRVLRLWIAEGSVLAVLAALLGIGLGTLYTRGLLFGLSTYWQGAVANAAIQFHSTPATLILGGTLGIVCAILAMFLGIRKQFRLPIRELLQLDLMQEQKATKKKKASRTLPIAIVALLGALGLSLSPWFLNTLEPMIAFFTSGTLLLIAGLAFFRHALNRVQQAQNQSTTNHRSLALKNMARRPGRSLTVVALLACGCFMVFAVAAMQEDLHAKAHLRSAGTGGFALMAESTFAIQEDILAEVDTPNTTSIPIKVRDGDDASCLNLNHAQSPRILGVNPDDLIALKAFANEENVEALWGHLNTQLPNGAIPALVGDTNTMMWTLKKKAHPENGDILEYEDDSGDTASIQLLSALPMRLSVFSGAILISNTHFTELFPGESGNRIFLIDTPAEHSDELTQFLQKDFDRYGIDIFPAVRRLLDLYSVETTYLAMFLVLGGLGVAVGSIGMCIVILRNLLERRKELAMLRAIGFTRDFLNQILFAEYGMLLLAGMLIGCISAGIATIPALFATESNIDISIQARLATTILLISLLGILAAIRIGLRAAHFDALRSE